MTWRSFGGSSFVWFVALASCRVAVAQCDPQWLQGSGTAGVAQSDNSAIQINYQGIAGLAVGDPDGNGPSGRVVVARGNFDFAGMGKARNIAIWNPETGNWRGLGNGLPPVSTDTDLSYFSRDLVAVSASGEICVATGGAIQIWNGSTWIQQQPPNTPSISTIKALADGDLLAGSDNGRVAVRKNGQWSNIGSILPRCPGAYGPISVCRTQDGRYVAATLMQHCAMEWVELGSTGRSRTGYVFSQTVANGTIVDRRQLHG